jgi:hypothetical protein
LQGELANATDDCPPPLATASMYDDGHMPCTSICTVMSYDVFPDRVNDWLCAPVDPGDVEDVVPATVTVTVTDPVPLVVT